ncbi:tellurite resistance TerB family protein [Nocardia bovistercoris]|uniref:Tellurite resistance TerB family protein n=1 Tax=Nocardia bovistercoris TaxID=2785916 RepID=A0A931IEW0_9NOCA|nr:TerB family tellurite resistance protein [Nocardia bovistercoris]MBH0780164.1 tellurite resistance TerB family protein [Nocardia bovistercoris]
MAFLNKLVSNAHTFGRLMDVVDKATQWRKQLLAKKNDLRGGAFRDAAMGMCALVAAADGAIDPNERMRVAGLVGSEPALGNFPADELRTLFEDNCARITADPAFGRAHVLQQIAKVANKPTEAEAVVQIGIMIGNADGNFDQAEVAAVREACQTLGLDPRQFGL